MTWLPERIGIPTPVFKPAIRAAADRGKLGSSVTVLNPGRPFRFPHASGKPNARFKMRFLRNGAERF